MSTPLRNDGPSAHTIAHMDEIMDGWGDWFSADLLRLIAKADLVNREKLRQAFPKHVLVYELWLAGVAVDERGVSSG